MKRSKVSVFMYLALILIIVGIWFSTTATNASTKTMNQFSADVTNGKVVSAVGLNRMYRFRQVQ